MIKQCIYGKHGKKRTWCAHEAIRGDRKSRSVDNGQCENCPFYSEGDQRIRVEQSSCSHRGDVNHSVECKVCGGKKKLLQVHSCELHGECAKDVYTFEMLRENGVKVKNCVACSDRSVEPLPSVAVVIPCHNYGEFLAEAVESVSKQTHQPVEIVVVDDSSTDNTQEVSEQLGVRYIRTEIGNVFESRKIGYEATDSGLLCFLDADDHLAPDYLEQAAKMMAADWKLGIVYSDMERFGAETGRTNFPSKFDPVKFQRDNYLHAGSVVRRSALRISQAFETPRPSHLTHEDYLLWGRVLSFGWHAQKSPAIYHYRRHENGSMITGRRNQSWYLRLGFNRAPVTILIPLAGRSHYWPELQEFLDSQTWPRDQCRIVLGDTSQDAEFSSMIREWIANCDYPDVRHLQFPVGSKGIADEDRRKVSYEVQDAVLRCWSRLTKCIDTDWTFCLEDDVIPPEDIIERLFKDLKGGVDGVVGPYMSRMMDHWTVYRNSRTVLPGEEATAVETIDGAGFGCLLVRSHLLQDHVWTHGPRQGDWYDPWFAKANRINLLCDWSIPVRHLPAEDSLKTTCN